MSRPFRPILVLALAALLFGGTGAPSAAETGPTGRVRGVVSGPDRKPLPGRLVTLMATDGSGELRVTSTDEKGRYQFRDLAPGLYEIRVEAEGFETGVKTGIEVRPPFQNVVDMPMRPKGSAAAGNPLAGLRAQASRAAAGAGSAAPGAAGPGAGSAGTDDTGAAAAPAADPVVLQGQLRDKDGAPILEATVLALPLVTGAPLQGRSDRDGKFRIEGVAPGPYRLLVRSPGHVPIDLSRVEVPAESGLSLRLVLADYPLNFKAGPDTTLPPERPRPWPPPPVAPPGTAIPAPEPEPAPQTPVPPEPS